MCITLLPTGNCQTTYLIFAKHHTGEAQTVLFITFEPCRTFTITPSDNFLSR